MQIINQKDLPLDHWYYRSMSWLYKKYLHKCWLKTCDLSSENFWWIKDLWLFQISKFERVDKEPDVNEIKKSWFKHWLLIWIPYSRTEIPKWWRRLFLNTHFTTTWFSKIEDEFYYKKWSERAKRARKKFLQNQDLRIEIVSNDVFSKYYKETKAKQPMKCSFVKYHKDLSNLDDNNDLRNILCFDKENKVLAWLSVINYNWNSSAHLVSFLTNAWKKVQAWTWLIDMWFKISLENWIKYINFDHLRDRYMSVDQKWYTEFKQNFMDFKVVFQKSYFKIF